MPPTVAFLNNSSDLETVSSLRVHISRLNQRSSNKLHSFAENCEGSATKACTTYQVSLVRKMVQTLTKVKFIANLILLTKLRAHNSKLLQKNYEKNRKLKEFRFNHEYSCCNKTTPKNQKHFVHFFWWD